MAEEEKVLSLFDFYWFDRRILTQPLHFLSPEHSVPAQDEDPIDPPKPPTSRDVAAADEQPQPQVGRLRSLLHRSLSDQFNANSDPFSPNSVLEVPKLDTIFSGKESCLQPVEVKGEEEAGKHSNKTSNRLRKKRSTKSLSDLEFEELKGFMDLGFTFSEGDVDSNLISILPGLQRLGKKDGEHEIANKSTVSRPYLSEAWDVSREEYNTARNYWSITSSGGDESDMKDRLKVWAQAVASTVR
ncbi:uncharacterized protein [Aristolochia californica]|uniref:uncharacterized protein n=1 Tax=Aristolochia californica TaxID=171875 RepID=UPI0035D7E91C